MDEAPVDRCRGAATQAVVKVHSLRRRTEEALQAQQQNKPKEIHNHKNKVLSALFILQLTKGSVLMADEMESY